MYNELEKMFYNDIRSKKKTASGAYHRKGKGARHRISGIRTPYDFLSTKEKRQLNGKVEVFNMYEKIIPRLEFEKQDINTQRAMMTYWRENYTLEDIKKGMGVAGATVYRIIERLGLPKRKVTFPSKKTAAANSKPAAVEVNQIKPAAPVEPVQTAEPVQVITKGLTLEFHGEYSSEKLEKIFEKLHLLISDEPNKFLVHISISEIERKDK